MDVKLLKPNDWVSASWINPESEVFLDFTNWLRLEVGFELVYGSVYPWNSLAMKLWLITVIGRLFTFNIDQKLWKI